MHSGPSGGMKHDPISLDSFSSIKLCLAEFICLDSFSSIKLCLAEVIRLGYYNFTARLVDLVGLYWLK